MAKELKVELGDRVQDKISGAKGIVVILTDWAYGCVRVTIQPEKINKDSKPLDDFTIDEPQAKVLKKGVYKPVPIATSPLNSGDRVMEDVSKFQGIAVGRSRWLTGVLQLLVQPEEVKDGEPRKIIPIDSHRLKLVKKDAHDLGEYKPKPDVIAGIKIPDETKPPKVPKHGPRDDASQSRSFRPER